MLFFVGFGWGKPVPVNPTNLSPNPKTGLGLVSLSGPASNIFIAFISTFPIRLGVVDISSVNLNYINSSFSIGQIIGITIFLNLLLATFNLLPIAPLDGFKIAIGILPRKLAYDFSKLEKNAFCLITDSGTIPEEALFFQKPCVTIRNTTERPEIIEAGSNILSGLSPENILQSTQTITSKKPDWQWNKALGDGKTARKVLNILGGNLY